MIVLFSLVLSLLLLLLVMAHRVGVEEDDTVALGPEKTIRREEDGK